MMFLLFISRRDTFARSGICAQFDNFIAKSTTGNLFLSSDEGTVAGYLCCPAFDFGFVGVCSFGFI